MLHIRFFQLNAFAIAFASMVASAAVHAAGMAVKFHAVAEIDGNRQTVAIPAITSMSK